MFLFDLIAGSVGGGCGIVVGQPLDVIKVRMQNNHRKIDLLSAVSTVYRQHGIRGFFAGMVSRFPKTISEIFIHDAGTADSWTSRLFCFVVCWVQFKSQVAARRPVFQFEYIYCWMWWGRIVVSCDQSM